MKNFNLIHFFGVLLISTNSYSSVKIVYTSALIPTHFEERKKEYIHSLNVLSKLNYTPYIIEAYKRSGPTFFENYCPNVFYAQTNNLKRRNKGVNEASTLLEGFNYFNFDDDDIILKLTGRYYFKSCSFIQFIQNNPFYDAYVKLDPYGQVFTGCFALRYKYFKSMLQQLDLINLEKRMINIERAVANFLIQNKINTMQLDNLDVIVCAYGNGNEYNKQPIYQM